MGVFRRVLKKSCEGSSMKALPKIIKATNTFQHLLWTIALLAGLSIAGYQLVKLLMGYLSFSTSVHIAEQLGTPPFPDVTICHQDPEWSVRNLGGDLDTNMFKIYMDRIEKRMSNYKNDSTEDYYLLEQLHGFPGFLQNNPFIGKQIEQLQPKFIIECSVKYNWDPEPCSQENVNYIETHAFVDPYFGFCITYQVLEKELIKGLSLVLYLDDPGEVKTPEKFDMSDYTKTHTSQIGARISIHPNNSFPDMMTASHLIPAGVDMEFKLAAIQRTILDEPYGDCISEAEAQALRAAGKSVHSTTRHLYECNRLCAKEAIIEQCGCLHIHHPLTQYDPRDIPLCGHIQDGNISATLSKIDCAEKVTIDLDTDILGKCPCSNPCSKFNYGYTTKAIEWPAANYHLSFYEQYIQNSSFASKFSKYGELLEMAKHNPTKAQKRVANLDLIHKNFVQVRVENHQQEFLHYSETPLISLESLFGTVGGLLNLWAGITFITIIEILDFVHQLITQGTERSATNGNAKPTQV